MLYKSLNNAYQSNAHHYTAENSFHVVDGQQCASSSLGTYPTSLGTDLNSAKQQCFMIPSCDGFQKKNGKYIPCYSTSLGTSTIFQRKQAPTSNPSAYQPTYKQAMSYALKHKYKV